MASRFPPTFSITQGLLSSQELTPEEEEALLQEQLYGLELEPPVDDDEEDAADEPYPTETNDELAPLPEEQAGRPLVIDAESVATPLSRQPTPVVGGVDPLAPLPEKAKEPARKEPKFAEKPPKGQPLVKDVPQVIDADEEDVDRSSNWVARHRAEAVAILKAQEENSTNVEVPAEQAAYTEHFQRMVNQMLADGSNASEILAAGKKLAKEVYEGNVQAEWDPASIAAVVRDFDTRQERGQHIPTYQVQMVGKKTDKTPEGPNVAQSLAKGSAAVFEMEQGAVEALKEVTGIGDPSKNAKRREYYSAIQQTLPQGIRLKDVQNFGDALEWAQHTALENAPSLAVAVSGGVLGGAIRGSLGAQMGAFGSSFVLETGAIQSQNKELNPDEKAGLATIIGGGAAAALDSILPGRIGAQLTSRVGKDAAEQIALRTLLLPSNQQLVARLRQYGTAGLGGMAIEGGTEAGQEVIEAIASSIETGQPIPQDLLYRMVEAGAAGALLGGPASVAGTAAENRGAVNAPIDEIAGAQFDTSGAVMGAQSPSQQAGAVPGVPSVGVATTPARPVVVSDAEKPDRPLVVSKTPEPVDASGRAQKFSIPAGKVTSKFGPRQTFRTANGQMASSNHAGIDIALPSGSPVPAGADGVVVFAGTKGGYGNQIIVQHSDGTTSSYSHLSKINTEVGDQVAQGQVIGKVGKTGNATGPHLHLERRDRQGRAVNPLTGGAVVTIRDESGQWTDNTDWEADQAEIDNFYEDMAEQQELDNAFTEATGQQFEAEFEEAALPEATEAPMAIARGVEAPEVIPEPAPKRGREIEAAVEEVIPQAGPSAPEVALARGVELEARKATSPARMALAKLQVPEADWTQPQGEEQPVFASADEGSEVMGFVTPSTGAFRAIGEPANVAAAQPEPTAPEVPAGPTAETTIPEEAPLPEVAEVPQAATAEQLELERLQRLFDALPKPATSASPDVVQGRVDGQQVGLGLQEAPADFAERSKSYKTAYNLGVKDAEKAVATPVAATSVGKLPQEVIPTAPDRQAAPPVISARPSRMAKPSAPKGRAAEIEARVSKIEDKLFDLETDGTKTAVRIYMQRLVKEGVLPADEVASLSYMFKDRDMGVEDITSEIRTSVNLWAENELSAKKPAKAKVKQQRAAPKEETNVTDSFTERARFRPPEGRVGRDDGATGQVGGSRTGSSNESRTGEPVGETPPVDADGNVVLDHFTLETNLTRTDPNQWGRSSKFLPEEERIRIGVAPGRTYFGIGTDRPGGYVNEFGGGVHPRFRTPVARVQAKIPLSRLYDMNGDPDGLKAIGRAMPKNERGQYIYKGKPVDGVSLYELLIRDAGYAGYWIKRLGMVAAVFEPVPVTPYGQEAKAETKQQRPSLRVSARVPVEIGENAHKKVLAVLKQMQLDGHPDLTVDILDKLESGALGEFDPNMMRIRIASMAGYDVGLTARHEIIHWAREAGIFSREEWATLAKWAKNHPGLMNWAKTNYANEKLSGDQIVEEAVAEGFSRWKGGNLMAITTDDKLVVKLFEKLLRVLAAIRNAFTGAGISRGQINAAAQIFSDLESGKLIKRGAGRNKPTVTFGKKRSVYHEGLAREMLAGNITPEQRHFLAENPSDVKFQSAWHGTPREDIDAFKLSYIGTGEGAQAFGWGLYFAQRQEVADWYRKKLVLGGSRDPVDIALQVEGEPMRTYFVGLGGYDSMAVYEVADRIMNFMANGKPYNGWLNGIWAEFDNDIEAWVEAATVEGLRGNAAETQSEIDALRASQRNVGDVFKTLIANGQDGQHTTIKFREVNGGKLYKVEVPENNELMFLDKKLSEQSDVVKAATNKIRGHMENMGVLEDFEDRLGDFDDWTGLELTRMAMPGMVHAGLFPEENISEELENAVTNGHAPMATSIWLRDLGVKGARFLDRDSRAGGDGPPTTNFVIFDDGAIQLKAKHRIIRTPMANSPLSDPTQPDPGIFRRIHDQTMGLLGAIAGKDVDAADNLVDAFRRKITQRYQQVIKTQSRAAQMLGVDRLPSGKNPMEMITADERGYKLQFLTDNMIRPMATDMSRRGVTMDDLGLFLYARHAPARNARIAKINPEFRDPANPGSGMTDAEAIQIMADFQNDGKLGDLQAVATHIDQMIDFAQQERLNSGLIDQADIAAGFQPGDFYVPLRGNENIEPELEMDFTLASRKGGGFSISGKEGHRMFGRSSKADLEDIVGYTITQAQEAIDRGYRNRVGQAMLGMFRATPDSDFVQIDRVKRVPVWNKKKGQVEYQMQTRITDPSEQQRTIYVKEGGHVTKMTFQAQNPSAMRFVKAAKNLGMSELPRILQIISIFTRLWSKSNTQWNPDFILANATKDVQTGVLNAKTLDVKGLRRSMLKNIASLKPLMATWMGATHGAGHGFNSANPWFQTFAEFEANGGKLNYGQIEPLEDALRSAKREIKNAGRSRAHPIRVATDVLTFIDHLNSAFENMTRLAAYKALRDRGIEAKQAAEAVRELTTNFQQHGEWGPKFNAAYGFANASVIGGARFMKTVAKAPQVAAGLVALGMLSDFLNSMWDEDEWDRYTEEDKHGNFIILLPEEFGFDIKVPAGYGLNAFVTAGRKMSELWRGKKNKDGTRLSVLDAASDAGMGFINAFAPITGASFWNIVTPTVADPIVNVYRNENNWGRPIMPTQPFRKEQQKPDSQLAFDNTSQFWKALATSVNDVGGGNDVIPGWTPTDISPETYKHVTEETVGGAGRTFLRTINLIEKAATGQDVGMNDIPIVRRFAGNPYGAATIKSEQVGQFYERLGEARVVIAQAKEMMARYGKESETYQDFRADNKPIIDFAETVAEAEKRLRAYNTAENAAERGVVRVKGLKRRDRKAIFKVTKVVVPAGRALTPEEVAKIKAKIKEKRERLALDFNDRYTTKVMGAE